jgi:membrane protease YdiL (CAAX protease family)
VTTVTPDRTHTPALWRLALAIYLPAIAISVIINVYERGILFVNGSFLDVSSYLLLMLPLIVVALRGQVSAGVPGLLMLTAAVTTMAATLLMLPMSDLISSVPGLEWYQTLTLPWANKLVLFAACLCFVALWRGMSWREVGFTLRLNPGSLRPIVIITVAVVLINVALSFLIDPDTVPLNEMILYQATLPGLDEELFFRGILLILLNRALGTPWRLWGAQIGWGLVISTLLFGLAHGFFWGEGGLSVDLVGIVVTGFYGFLLGWVRERSGSLIPAIVMHNLMNTVLFLPLLFF